MEIRPHWLTGLLLLLIAIVQPLLWRASTGPAGRSAALEMRGGIAAATPPPVPGHLEALGGVDAVGSFAIALALTCQLLIGLGTLLPPGRRWVGWVAVVGAAAVHAQIFRLWYGFSWEAGAATLLAISTLQSILLRIGRLELRPASMAPPRRPATQLSVGDFFVATTLLAVLWRLARPDAGIEPHVQASRGGAAVLRETLLFGDWLSCGTYLFGWPLAGVAAITTGLVGLAVVLIAWDTQISRAASVANLPPREA